MAKGTLLPFALWYMETHKFSVIPIGENKRPLVEWKEYQSRLPTREEIERWWTIYPSAQVGIVTGVVSGIAVIDVDTDAGKEAIKPYLKGVHAPSCITPRGGQHYYFKCTDPSLNNNARAIEGCDLRANGGYVLAPPSKGKGYKWVKGLELGKVVLCELPETYLEKVKNNSNGNGFFSTKSDIEPLTFTKGSRDNTIFHIANQLIKSSTPEPEVRQILRMMCGQCRPPFPESEMERKIESAITRASKRESNVAQEVFNVVRDMDGVFTSTDVHKLTGISTSRERKTALEALRRLIDQGVIKKYGRKQGVYRKIGVDRNPIIYTGQEVKEVDLNLPFRLHDFCIIFPKNIILIAGSKDAGKTSFLMNFCNMNPNLLPDISYFNSEMGGMEWESRIRPFSNLYTAWKDGILNVEECSKDWADFVKPDGISVIDYMEVTNDFWRVGEYIKDIHDTLTTGICIIALQKPIGADMGRGGQFTLDKPRLYLLMDYGTLIVRNLKTPRPDAKNIRGMMAHYRIEDGWKLIQKDNWHYPPS